MELLSRWTFECYFDPEDGAVVYSHVEANVLGKEVYHTTHGALHDAIIEAYEEVGIVCPFVIEKDLMNLKESQDGDDRH